MFNPVPVPEPTSAARAHLPGPTTGNVEDGTGGPRPGRLPGLASRPGRLPGLATRLAAMLAALSACAAIAPAGAAAFDHSFIGSFTKVTAVGSTVPTNGDENPYGIVNVSRTNGSLVAGDILISNFNDSSNLQGTGSTLVQLTPGGHASLFAQINPASLPGACPGGVGLTTALTILPQG